MTSDINPFDLFPGSIPIGPDNRYKISDQEDNREVLRAILGTQLTLMQQGQVLILSPEQIEKLGASAKAPFNHRSSDGRGRRVFVSAASAVINPGKMGGEESLDAIREDYVNYHSYLRALAGHIGVNLDTCAGRDNQPLVKPYQSVQIASF